MKDQLIEVPSDEVGRVENNIDNFPFYHGFMGRNECEAMLSNHGDFLIRMTEIGKRVAYVISIKWKYQNIHVLVKRTKTVRVVWYYHLVSFQIRPRYIQILKFKFRTCCIAMCSLCSLKHYADITNYINYFNQWWAAN